MYLNQILSMPIALLYLGSFESGPRLSFSQKPIVFTYLKLEGSWTRPVCQNFGYPCHQKSRNKYIFTCRLQNTYMDSISRRRLLELTSVGAVTGTAGCSNILGSSESTTSRSSNTSGKSRAELQNRIAELQSRVESLQGNVSSKEEEIASLNQDLEELQEKSSEKDQTARSLRSDLRDAEARIEELESQSVEYQYSAEVRQSATDAGRKLREAVVAFEFEYDGNSRSEGTGWFIDQNHIITNRHVIQGVVEGTVTSKTGYLLDGTEFDFSVSHTAEDDDIALVETDVTAPYVPPLGTASSLTAGQPLVQVGHPAMIGYWVISLGEFLKDQEFGNGLHTEMPSTSGNSGSPLITLDGTVVGLTYASASRDIASGSPTPSEEGAVEEYPYQEVQYSIHEGIDTVLDYYEQWTGN